MLSASAIALIAIALAFSYLNGAKDGANALATIIASRSLSPRMALAIVGLCEFAGPFVFGIAVATTIGTNVVDPAAITINVVIAALASASLWNVFTWRLGIPTSSSHALVGGLVGAVVAANSFDYHVLQTEGLVKIAVGLFLAPILGLVLAFVVMEMAMFILRSATPRVNWFFKRAQLFTTAGLALSHGANDAPKTMGMITLGLVAAGVLPEFDVPLWIVLASAGAVALGTVTGSWRMVRSIGTRFYRVRPFHAFNTQFTSGLIVVLASYVGSPVSTSQVVSSAIAGVGAAERLSKVRWGFMGEMILGWLLTMPVAGIAGSLTYLLIRNWFGP